MKSIRFGLLWTICLAFSLTVSGQSVDSAAGAPEALAGKASKVVFDSKLMGREMPYNLLLPAEYGSESNKEMRYPVVYLLHGLTGHFDDWANKTGVSKYSRSCGCIIVMPEGNDGWYTDSATVPADRYESYVIQELIPEIDKQYRTKAERSGRAIAGLSMGGYGAIKFGLKYPQLFFLAGSFSGALAVTELTDKNSSAWVSKSVMGVYGDASSETRKNNDIFRLVREMPAEKVRDLPYIYLDCGTEDFLFNNNREFVSLLAEKKVQHEFRQLPGGHDWKFWDSQVQEFLRLREKLTRK